MSQSYPWSYLASNSGGTHTNKHRERDNDRESQIVLSIQAQRGKSMLKKNESSGLISLALPSWLSEHRPCGLFSPFALSSEVNIPLCVQISRAWFPASQFTHNISFQTHPNLLQFFPPSFHLAYLDPLEFSFHLGGCQLHGTVSICICVWEHIVSCQVSTMNQMALKKRFTWAPSSGRTWLWFEQTDPLFLCQFSNVPSVVSCIVLLFPSICDLHVYCDVYLPISTCQ